MSAGTARAVARSDPDQKARNNQRADASGDSWRDRLTGQPHNERSCKQSSREREAPDDLATARHEQTADDAADAGPS